MTTTTFEPKDIIGNVGLNLQSSRQFTGNMKPGEHVEWVSMRWVKPPARLQDGVEELVSFAATVINAGKLWQIIDYRQSGERSLERRMLCAGYADDDGVIVTGATYDAVFEPVF